MRINGVEYHVEVSGVGEPLVLLHGFSGSGASWAAQVEALVATLRVVTVDLLGHGQTHSPPDPARYRIEAAAADLIAIFDALELPQVNLLGYSMGGRLALYTALYYPNRIRCLILESASPGLRTEAERAARVAADEALAQRIERDGVAAFADYWSSLPLFATQSPELRERLRLQRLNNNPVGLANSLRGMGTGTQPSLWEQLRPLHKMINIMLIVGELDKKFCDINLEMLRRMLWATFIAEQGAGHTVHAERPERYNDRVLVFSRQHSVIE